MNVLLIAALTLAVLFPVPCRCWALDRTLASPQQLKQLEKDLRENILTPGTTMPDDIRAAYGEADSINYKTNEVTYNYGKITLKFKITKILQKYEFDQALPYFKQQDDIEKGLKTGMTTLADLIVSYGDPTPIFSDTPEAGMTTCYYGQLRLILKDNPVLDSWSAQNTEGGRSAPQGVLVSEPKQSAAEKAARQEANK